MSEQADTSDALLTFVQADVAARAAHFAGFVRLLKEVATNQGAEAARDWARRAVSPLMDYSSLMKLRGLLDIGTASSEGVLRLAILGGPTTRQLRQLIEIFLSAAEISVEIFEADYGLFRHEVLAPNSQLNDFQPQVIFLATSARDVARYPEIGMDEAAVVQTAEIEISEWLRLWETANHRWNATVIQNNFELSPDSVMGHYGLRHPAARENYLERLNRMMVDRAPSFVVLHSLRGLADQAGAKAWFDARYYLEFKMPCGPECLVTYAASVVSLLRAMVGKSRKALVLDLDNTMWGGVVGDLGAGGVRVGQGSSEGEAYLAFQRYVRMLKDRGVLLAVCSKNDLDKAREVFEKREDMLLKLADFAAFFANWNNKVDNLLAIAKQLNIKTDALVFVDDNPAERALVRRLLPEVATPDMPTDAAGYIEALARYRFFETCSFTREDSARAEYYAQEARRQSHAERVTDIGAFLESLQMFAKVEPINDLNLERATQLINKSNQFNLTTRRYTPAQIREISTSPDWRTLTISLRDSFGDNGLISVILLHKVKSAFEIDTWVMSCRVLQRGVEQLARNLMVEIVHGAECDELRGNYLATAKNGPVRELFANLGFRAIGSNGDDSFWSLPVVTGTPPLAHTIRMLSVDGLTTGNSI